MKKMVSMIISIVMILGIMQFTAVAETRVIICTTTEEINYALYEAQPGDVIKIAPGEYLGKKGSSRDKGYSGYGNGWFFMNNAGTAGNPITITALEPLNPPLLHGQDNSSYNFYMQNANYVNISGINFANGQKGLVMDNSSNCVISYCEFTSYGDEAVHFRDGSSNNTLANCTITDTGIKSPGFGEGVYVGSDKNKWEPDSSVDTGTSMFIKECDNNTIINCRIGPLVRAECVDIKEGTTGTKLINCYFDMSDIMGVSAANYADSAIDIKGNDVIIHQCTFYDGGNTLCLEAIQLHSQTEDRLWGHNAKIADNTFNLTACTAEINATHDTDASIYGNICSNGDIRYIGDITVLTEHPFGGSTTPTTTTTTPTSPTTPTTPTTSTIPEELLLEVYYVFNDETDTTDIYRSREISYFTIPTATPIRDGYTFLGWSYNSDATEPNVYPNDIVNTHPVTSYVQIYLYAVWEKDSEKSGIYVYFDANGGTNAPDNYHSNLYLFPVPEQIPIREGYTFLGWAYDSKATVPDIEKTNDGLIIIVDLDPSSPYKEITLYAVWKNNSTILCGDLNDDGDVNTADLIIIAKNLTGRMPLSNTQKAAANLDSNPAINADDLLVMIKFLVGSIKSLPVE